jgi:hypothetical protein
MHYYWKRGVFKRHNTLRESNGIPLLIWLPRYGGIDILTPLLKKKPKNWNQKTSILQIPQHKEINYVRNY